VSATSTTLDADYRRQIRRSANRALNGVVNRCMALMSAMAAQPGAQIRVARQARLGTEDVVTYAVLAEHEAGASWETIADWLAEDVAFVAAHYGEIEMHYRATGSIRP
jgi:hypothetical protein